MEHEWSHMARAGLTIMDHGSIYHRDLNRGISWLNCILIGSLPAVENR